MVFHINSKITQDSISEFAKDKNAFWGKKTLSFFEALKNEKNEYIRMIKCEEIIKALHKAKRPFRPSDIFNPDWNLNGKEVEGLIRRAQTRIRFVFSGVLKLSELAIPEYVYMFLWDGVKRNDLINLIHQEQSGQKPSPIQFNLLKRFENLMSPKKNEMRRFQSCESTIGNLTRKGIPVNPRLLFNPERNLKDEETEVLIKKAQSRIKLVFDGKLELKELTTPEYVYMFLWDRIKRDVFLNLIKQESLGKKIHPNPFKPLTYFDELKSAKDEEIKLVQCNEIIDKLNKEGIPLRPRLLFNPDGNLKKEEVDEIINKAKNKISLVRNGELRISELDTAEYVYLVLSEKIEKPLLLQIIEQEKLGKKLFPHPLKPLTYFKELEQEKDEAMKMVMCQRIIKKLQKEGIPLRPSLLFNPDRNLKPEEVDKLIKEAKRKIRSVTNAELPPSALTTAEYVFLFLWKPVKSRFTMQEHRYQPKMKEKKKSWFSR